MLLAYVHLNQLCTTKMVMLEGLLRNKFNNQELKKKNNNSTKQEISGESSSTGGTFSKQEPPFQNGIVERYAIKSFFILADLVEAEL